MGAFSLCGESGIRLVAELSNERFAYCVLVHGMFVQAGPRHLFPAFFEGFQNRFCGLNGNLVILSKRI